jgi:hypothetical protein
MMPRACKRAGIRRLAMDKEFHGTMADGQTGLFQNARRDELFPPVGNRETPFLIIEEPARK